MDRWIKVSERTPPLDHGDSSAVVLVAKRSRSGKLMRGVGHVERNASSPDSVIWFDASWGGVLVNVAFWQPFPELPKE